MVKRVLDSVYVKTEDGSVRKFTEGELKARGIQVVSGWQARASWPT